MQVFARTDIGRLKKENQDYFYYTLEKVGLLDNLFILADGMGGYNSGDFASKFTTETLISELKKSEDDKNLEGLFYKSILEVDRKLVSKSISDDKYEGMGTTLVVLSINDMVASISNIGDSRLYLYSNDSLKQVTQDHSLVNELYKLGKITKERARNHEDKNKITRAVGYGSEPDYYKIDVREGDYILICSDGLSNMVCDEDIQDVIREKTTIEDKCNKLVDMANNNGGLDNITVMLVKI